MITKEELIDIMKEGWQPTGYYSVNFNANMVADKILERIKQELEVLEIIKSKLNIGFQLEYLSKYGSLITSEEYQKIKEWLEEKE